MFVAQGPPMLYHAYELQRSWMNSASALASISANVLSNPANPLAAFGMGPLAASALDVFAHATAHYGKPAFGIESVAIDGAPHTVIESVVMKRPFGNLLRFRVEGTPADRPRLLIVAPMSGHYATLLRGTVERMLESAEVFITDWADAKMVPADAGKFDLDDYIDHLMEFAELSNVEKLRRLFDAFTSKRDILHLLDQSLGAEGVQIFIGQESGYQILDNCSLVTAPYALDNETVGVLGVIGPTRMAYDRVIPIVDVTARLLGSALNSRR